MPRKPYLAKQSKYWYRENPYYVIYMIRELTSVPVALATLNLFWGLAALAASPQAWAYWTAVQRAPIMLLFNLIAIAAAVFNTLKWFAAMPKAIRIQQDVRFISERTLITASWIAFAAISLVLLVFVICLS